MDWKKIYEERSTSAEVALKNIPDGGRVVTGRCRGTFLSSYRNGGK